MKKNGFIATSLIYSFFLVFCAVLLSFVAISAHNRNLLNKVYEEINADLKDKRLSDAEIGAYFKIMLTHPSLNTDDVNWLVYNKDATNVYLVSNTVVLQTNKVNTSNDLSYEYALENEIISRFSTNYPQTQVRIFNYNDYNTVSSSAFTDIVKNRIFNIGLVYIMPYNNSSYEYDNGTLTSGKTYAAGSSLAFRLVVSMPTRIGIIGGNGTISNPYIV